ncbi:hypothetical protein [Micromonospora auratinigra]|uniref:hypothetical protein n=1 Tax=Micromonospora auratinigra TaxID=261654 RepID=UPI00143029CF|nr:hypothetical protein [Micromonospora auratinigra]
MLSLVVASVGLAVLSGHPQRAVAVTEDQNLPAGAKAVASAPLFEKSGQDFVVVQGPDGRLFYNTGGRSGDRMVFSSKGWREIPGGMTTDHRPAVALLHSDGAWNSPEEKIVIAVTSGGKVMIDSYLPDGTFGSWVEAPGTQPGFYGSGPSIAVDGAPGQNYSQMTVFARGSEGGIYYNRLILSPSTPTQPGTATWERWKAWGPTVDDNRGYGGPAAAYLNGRTKVVVGKKTAGQATSSLVWSDFTPDTAPNWQPVPGGMAYQDLEGPSIGRAGQNVLSIAVKGTTPTLGDRVQAINLVETTPGAPVFGKWVTGSMVATRLAPVSVSVAGSNASSLHMYVIGRDRTVGVTALVPGSDGSTDGATLKIATAEGYTSDIFSMVPDSDALPELRPAPDGADWTTTLPQESFLNPDPWQDRALQGTDGVGVTRMGSSSDNMIIARKISDSRVYASIGHQSASADSWQSFGWAPIPGKTSSGMEVKTDFAPAAATYGNDIYVAVVAADKKMYTQRFHVESKMWDAVWSEAPAPGASGQFIGAPTLTVWHGALQAFGPGADSQVYWLQGTPLFSVGHWEPLSGLTTKKAVGAVEFNHDLVVVARAEGGTEDGKIKYRRLGSFDDGGTSWTDVSLTTRTGHAPAVTVNSGVLHILVRDAASPTGEIRYRSAIGNLGAWRQQWDLVPPGTGAATSDAPAVTRNGSNVVAVVTGNVLHDVWNFPMVTDPATGALAVTDLTGADLWRRVPYSQVLDVPLDSQGNPIPAPPAPGTPWVPPTQPVINWYVFCLTGPNIPDGYIPTLDENQTLGEAQAREFATEQYGPTGWTLTFVANPTTAGCTDQTREFKFCATKYQWPWEPDWLTYVVSVWAEQEAEALKAAKAQVTAAHGPEYNNGHQSWGVDPYDPNQCLVGY